MLLKIFLSSVVALAQKKPVIAQVSENQYISWNDVTEMKLMFLGFIVLALINTGRWAWDLIQKKNDKTQANLEALISSMTRLESEVRQIKETQVTHGEVKRVVREEIEYVERIRHQ